MKNNFKKIVLTFSAITSSIGSYMFSGAGIAAATLGSLTAATVFAVEKKKTKKQIVTKKEETQPQETTKKVKKTTQQKELRKKITSKKKELRNHRNELKQLEKTKKGATPEAQKHRTIIQDLEDDINNIKRVLRNL